MLVSGVCVTGIVLATAIFWFFKSAPPTSLTISCGPEGSIFHTNAVKYQAILARSGVKLTVLTSQGSIEIRAVVSPPGDQVATYNSPLAMLGVVFTIRAKPSRLQICLPVCRS